MSEPLVAFSYEGDEPMYLPADVAEEYRRKFEEQSARFSDVFEGAQITLTPIVETDGATATLDEIYNEIEAEGVREQKRWKS